MKVARLLVSIASLAGCWLDAQPQPKFEVASIRPSPPSVGSMGVRMDGGRVYIGHWSITQLIMRAYGLASYQLSGPNWMGTLRFDVAAKFPEGAGEAELPQMLQGLLAERFGLAAHRETRNLPGFALVAGKDGPKMKAAPECTARPDRGRTLDDLFGDGASFGATTAPRASGNGDVHMEFQKLPMDALALILASFMREPVLDMTHLEGCYQVTLDIAPPGPMAPDASGTSVFSTVRRLGLRLEQHKTAVSVLVVDRVEQAPTEN